MNTFLELCREHGTDKGDGHRYDEAYDRFLEPYRIKPGVRLLEIGAGNGAGLRVFRDYFSDAKLFAIELERSKAFQLSPDITIFVGDQHDAVFLAWVVSESSGQFDIIIDDGSHRCRDQLASFEILWPALAPGGLYVIEDLESSLARKGRNQSHLDGSQTTFDTLIERVTKNVWHRRRKAPPIVYAFAGEACFIFKPEND